MSFWLLNPRFVLSANLLCTFLSDLSKFEETDAKGTETEKEKEAEMGVEIQSPQEQSSYTVEQLVALNPFNPEILPDLENYVNVQFPFPFLSSRILL